MAKSEKIKVQVPEELFHAIAALVNRLIYISEEECGLKPIQLLILWHCRHFGKTHLDDQTVILRQEITRMLKEKFHYTDGGISKMLAELQDEGFVLRAAITTQERYDLFGAHGDTRVVILNANGKRKIEQFKDLLRSRVDNWVSVQPRATRLAIRAVRPIVENLARWLVMRYEPEREAVLYPSETGQEGS